jgi:hypothetical protein
LAASGGLGTEEKASTLFGWGLHANASELL